MKFQNSSSPDEEAPTFAAAAPRLRNDMRSLRLLFEGNRPPVRNIRCSDSTNFFYGIGDASGTSFGSLFEKDGFIQFECGQWCTESSEESSNWRELKNVVEAIIGFVKRHELHGSEIFIFTDNSTAEAAFWKGSSTSEKLFELVLELRKLEMDHSLHLHVVHVSGRRMIKQGMDSLSRGDHSQGSMNRELMRSFIPLHLTAFERSQDLLKWMKMVTKGMGVRYLKPLEWFKNYHDFGNFVWAPPPVAGEVVVEQLAKSRWKQPEGLHLIVLPRLMIGRWQRHLARGSDFVFKLDLAPWDLSVCCEPLLIFICLPYRSHNPKIAERKRLLEAFAKQVQLERLSMLDQGGRGDLLRKLLLEARSLCPL